MTRTVTSGWRLALLFAPFLLSVPASAKEPVPARPALLVAHHWIVDQCPSAPPNENGVAEPGEGVEIRVAVKAGASAQTGVSGVLKTSTPGITIVDGTATWPNLSPGVSTSSNPPHFKIRIDPSVPCLTPMSFQLLLTSNEGGPVPMSFSENVGAAFTPGGLPLSIPDASPAGVTSTLAVARNATLTDVNVRVQITHTRVGDLFLELRSPDGTEVVLLDRPGYPASTLGCDGDDMDVTFDDQSAVALETWCTNTTPWYSGVGHPTGSLAAFNGQSSVGKWVLTVSDHAGGGDGTVTSWQLLTTPVLSSQCTVCNSAVPIASVGRAVFELAPSRPNPTAPWTDIPFQLSRTGPVTLRIYDTAGRVVSTLVDAEMSAGPHTVTWDGNDRSHKPVPPGIYFYRLTSGAETAIRRMQLVR